MKPSNYDLQVDLAKQLFLQYDAERLIRKFSLNADDDYLYVRYLTSTYRIRRASAQVDQYANAEWAECRAFETVMTIYDLLCHSKDESLPERTNQWCTVGTFIVTGVSDAEPFTKDYAAFFNGRLQALISACETLGGRVLPRMAGADLTCQIPVTSFFDVLVQFWQGDEEFPPKLLLLWDKNTCSFLHFETTFYLQGDLLKRLKTIINEKQA